MAFRKIFEMETDYDPAYLDVEDSGCAQIYTADIDGEEEEDGMFVRIQSWSSAGNHPEMDKLKGKRIRVTIEILD